MNTDKTFSLVYINETETERIRPSSIVHFEEVNKLFSIKENHLVLLSILILHIIVYEYLLVMYYNCLQYSMHN